MTETKSLKRTALYQKHVEAGAKIVEFAGYEMPLQYTGLLQEHMAVRKNVGMFDVSHMGEFIIKGENAKDLLEWITSNNISKLIDGQAQYNCLPNEQGGIIDDLIVYRWSENEYNLVVNAANIEKDWQWIEKQNQKFGAELENISDKVSLLAIQGPKATELLQELTDINLSKIPFYHFVGGEMAGIKDVMISNTGYTGSGGFELYVWNEDATKMWDAIVEKGHSFDLALCGLAARDTLRLEKGFCLYGNDIDDTTSPIEAGLGWITKFDAPFVNSDYHKKLKEDKPQRKLIGFEMIEKGIPRKDYEILNENDEYIGIVTSGTQSPILNKGIGMGYVHSNYQQKGAELFIQIRNKKIKAQVVKMPFV